MLYKSNLLTLELLYIVDVLVSIDAGPKWPLFYSHLDPVWSLLIIGTGFVLWVELPVQRRLCPIFVSGVGLPDIHEYSAG